MECFFKFLERQAKGGATTITQVEVVLKKWHTFLDFRYIFELFENTGRSKVERVEASGCFKYR